MVKQFLTRLNPRQNWPLIIAGSVLVASFIIIQNIPYDFSKSVPFDIGEVVDYPKLLFNYGGFPIKHVLILMSIGFLSLFVIHLNTKSSTRLAGIIFIATITVLLSGCAVDMMNSLSGDETSLSHVQTLHRDTITYQLTRVRNRDDSGLLWDSFWVFRCEADEIHCLYVEHMGRKSTPVAGDRTPEPSAKLGIEPASKLFYLQIGDEKTYIAP